MRFIIKFSFLVSVLLISSILCQARIWTCKNNRTFEGELISFNAATNTAIIRRFIDNYNFTLQLSELSEQDRTFIINYFRQNLNISDHPIPYSINRRNNSDFLALIRSHTTPSDSLKTDPTHKIFQDVTLKMPLREAMHLLGLESISSSHRITSAGWNPLSFEAHYISLPRDLYKIENPNLEWLYSHSEFHTIALITDRDLTVVGVQLIGNERIRSYRSTPRVIYYDFIKASHSGRVRTPVYHDVRRAGYNLFINTELRAGTSAERYLIISQSLADLIRYNLEITANRNP